MTKDEFRKMFNAMLEENGGIIYAGEAAWRMAQLVAALRAAIEQAKPWVKTYSNGEPQYTTPEEQAQTQGTHWEGCEEVHPECRKPEQEPVAWQGLTGEEVAELTLEHAGYPVRLTEAIEAKLREKNT